MQSRLPIDPSRAVALRDTVPRMLRSQGDVSVEVALPDEIRPGDAIGRYVILGVVGQGSMGIVFSAYDPQLDRRVAIKLLHPGVDQVDHFAQCRLVREAQVMASVSHPNIVQVYDASSVRGRFFMAMEYVDGCNLRTWLGRAPRTVPQILQIFRQAGEGLAAAHAAGIVHRDFKPANVLVDRLGRAKVVDFGLSRRRGHSELPRSGEPLSSAAVDITMSGWLMGTPQYMAPEQFAGETGDVRSDQYAFCVALYEALYEQPPFEGDDLEAIASCKQSQAALQRPTTAVEIPDALWIALRRGLACNPAERFPSMRALLDALGRSTSPSRWIRRFLLPLGAAGLVLIAWSQHIEPPPPPETSSSIAQGPIEHCTAEDLEAERALLLAERLLEDHAWDEARAQLERAFVLGLERGQADVTTRAAEAMERMTRGDAMSLRTTEP